MGKTIPIAADRAIYQLLTTFLQVIGTCSFGAVNRPPRAHAASARGKRVDVCVSRHGIGRSVRARNLCAAVQHRIVTEFQLWVSGAIASRRAPSHPNGVSTPVRSVGVRPGGARFIFSGDALGSFASAKPRFDMK